MPRLGVFAVIPDELGRVLLLHRTDFDLWNLPGGGLEEGEAPWEGCLREVLEETTLTVEVERLTGLYHKPLDGEIAFVFLCRITGGRLSPTEEADDLRWFALDDIPANTSPRHVERIRDALSAGPEPVLRVQKGPGGRELIERMGG